MAEPAASRYWALIPAAGAGVRMRLQRPKQYAKLRGRTLIEHSLHTFLQAGWIDGIVVVVAPGDDDFAKLAISRHWKITTAPGGATRAESVLAGVRVITEKANSGSPPFVLVHDAVRPCITREDIERLRDEASDEQGGLLALPVADTLKRAESSRAAATVPRRELWRAQTPQLFRVDLLRDALEASIAQSVDATDEARAMEAAGRRPKLVMGREANIKVTYPDDLAWAEFWLERQENGR